MRSRNIPSHGGAGGKLTLVTLSVWSQKLVLVCETTAALLPSTVSRVFKNEVRKLNWKYIIENWKAHAHAVE